MTLLRSVRKAIVARGATLSIFESVRIPDMTTATARPDGVFYLPKHWLTSQCYAHSQQFILAERSRAPQQSMACRSSERKIATRTSRLYPLFWREVLLRVLLLSTLTENLPHLHFPSPSFPDPKIAFRIPHANPPSDLTCWPASLKSSAIARLIAVSRFASSAAWLCCSCSAGVTCCAKMGSLPSRRACSLTSSG